MSDYISLGSLFISFVAIIFTLVTNTKKFELTGAQRSELLDWFYKTTEILIFLRLHISEDKDCNKLEYLSRLSALIEHGRFYFPNIDKGDGHGSEKPSAYSGYRDITLAFLIYSYDILKRKDAIKYVPHLEQLQRLFTSRIFDTLTPRKYNKLIRKNTILSKDNGMCLEDFLATDPNNSDYFNKYLY